MLELEFISISFLAIPIIFLLFIPIGIAILAFQYARNNLKGTFYISISLYPIAILTTIVATSHYINPLVYVPIIFLILSLFPIILSLPIMLYMQQKKFGRNNPWFKKAMISIIVCYALFLSPFAINPLNTKYSEDNMIVERTKVVQRLLKDPSVREIIIDKKDLGYDASSRTLPPQEKWLSADGTVELKPNFIEFVEEKPTNWTGTTSYVYSYDGSKPVEGDLFPPDLMTLRQIDQHWYYIVYYH